jgi:hypothetical protein
MHDARRRTPRTPADRYRRDATVPASIRMQQQGLPGCPRWPDQPDAWAYELRRRAEEDEADEQATKDAIANLPTT